MAHLVWSPFLSSFLTRFITSTSTRLSPRKMSSSNLSQTLISSDRNERIEAVLKKLKAIGASSTPKPTLKEEIVSSPSGKYIIPSRRTPSPPPQVCDKYVIPSRRTQSPPPSHLPPVAASPPPSPIIIIYSSETHQPFPTPYPKRLRPTFPSPPMIELPRERKICIPGCATSCSSEFMDEGIMLGRLFEAVVV